MGVFGSSLLYPACENPARVERYLDGKGNANRVFNLKEEMGPHVDWRHKLHTMGEKPSLAMIVADYTSGDAAVKKRRVDVLNRLLDMRINVDYATNIGCRLVDVLKSKGDYYPGELIARADPDGGPTASVLIIKGDHKQVL